MGWPRWMLSWIFFWFQRMSADESSGQMVEIWRRDLFLYIDASVLERSKNWTIYNNMMNPIFGCNLKNETFFLLVFLWFVSLWGHKCVSCRPVSREEKNNHVIVVGEFVCFSFIGSVPESLVREQLRKQMHKKKVCFCSKKLRTALSRIQRTFSQKANIQRTQSMHWGETLGVSFVRLSEFVKLEKWWKPRNGENLIMTSLNPLSGPIFFQLGVRRLTGLPKIAHMLVLSICALHVFTRVECALACCSTRWQCDALCSVPWFFLRLWSEMCRHWVKYVRLIVEHPGFQTFSFCQSRLLQTVTHYSASYSPTSA